MVRLARGIKPTSRLLAPIPPKCGGARVCFGLVMENKRRLVGKEMANKTIRGSARKMRPNISSNVAWSFGIVARIHSLGPSQDRHDAFDERRDRDCNPSGSTG